jgi:hypothetical protein
VSWEMATSSLRVNVGGVSSFSREEILRSPGSESPVSCPSSPSQFFGQRLATVSSPRESKTAVAKAAGARAYTGTEESRFAPTKNLYDLLGVSKTATPREIKAAYRMAARRLHPDVVPEEQRFEATKSFLEVQETYSILANPETRAAYDLSVSMNSFRCAGFSNRGPVSYSGREEVAFSTPTWGFTSSPTSSSYSNSFSFKGHNWETDQCW